jgi:hypothetical protein
MRTTKPKTQKPKTRLPAPVPAEDDWVTAVEIRYVPRATELLEDGHAASEAVYRLKEAVDGWQRSLTPARRETPYATVLAALHAELREQLATATVVSAAREEPEGWTRTASPSPRGGLTAFQLEVLSRGLQARKREVAREIGRASWHGTSPELTRELAAADELLALLLELKQTPR